MFVCNQGTGKLRNKRDQEAKCRRARNNVRQRDRRDCGSQCKAADAARLDELPGLRGVQGVWAQLQAEDKEGRLNNIVCRFEE